jgi:hypothetical protein
MTRIAFAVFAGAILAGGSAIAACPNDQLNNSHTKARQTKTHAPSSPCIDFNAVPQISANVAATTPAPVAKHPTYGLPSAGAYEGPTLGFTKPDPGHPAAPTVGYQWRLE